MLNSTSKTFIGATALTTSNAEELYAVKMDTSSTLTNGVESQVTLSTATAQGGTLTRTGEADAGQVGAGEVGKSNSGNLLIHMTATEATPYTALGSGDEIILRGSSGDVVITLSGAPTHSLTVLTVASANYTQVGSIVDGETYTLYYVADKPNEIIGAYHRNPGHDGNPVGVNVSGEFEIRVSAAITNADLGKGLVSGITAGIAEVAATIGTGFGKILGGRSVGTKHFARILVVSD